MHDAAALAEIVVDAMRLGLDPGGPDTLDAYERARRLDMPLAMEEVTDGLNRLFSNDILPVRLIRDLRLGLVDRMPGLKRFLCRRPPGPEATGCHDCCAARLCDGADGRVWIKADRLGRASLQTPSPICNNISVRTPSQSDVPWPPTSSIPQTTSRRSRAPPPPSSMSRAGHGLPTFIAMVIDGATRSASAQPIPSRSRLAPTQRSAGPAQP